MLATLVDSHSWLTQARDNWLFERKLDGLRCLAVRNGERVELWSRNHKPFTDRFPDVVVALAALPVDNFTLDGELVAFDGHDFAGFGALVEPGGSSRAVYCIFDLVHLLGRDTRGLTLAERRKLMGQAVDPGDDLRLVEELAGDPADLLASACAQGWEGLVAKRAN